MKAESLYGIQPFLYQHQKNALSLCISFTESCLILFQKHIARYNDGNTNSDIMLLETKL
jgi:hypothetical protein